MPTHYGFKVPSKLDTIRKRYEKLESATPEVLEKEKTRLFGRQEKSAPPSDTEVRAVIAALDGRGAWVEQGKLKYHPGKNMERPIISSATFARNLDLLSRYVAAKK